MSIDAGKRQKARSFTLPWRGRPLTSGEIKSRLWENQLTLKDWAEANGFAYDTVSCVVRGVHRATYGTGHRIAVRLGLKAE